MNKLNRTRVKYNLKGARVARTAGIDKSYYLNIEKGLYNPSHEVATRIAKAFTELTGTKQVTSDYVWRMNLKIVAKAKAARIAAQSKKAA